MENISFMLFGASIITLLRNILDYYHNAKYLNSDMMGAMINWHYGFLMAWVLLSIGISCYPGFAWYHGVICLPLVIFTSFLFWFPINRLLKAFGLIEKDEPSPKKSIPG